MNTDTRAGDAKTPPNITAELLPAVPLDDLTMHGPIQATQPWLRVTEILLAALTRRAAREGGGVAAEQFFLTSGLDNITHRWVY